MMMMEEDGTRTMIAPDIPWVEPQWDVIGQAVVAVACGY